MIPFPKRARKKKKSRSRMPAWPANPRIPDLADPADFVLLWEGQLPAASHAQALPPPPHSGWRQS